MWRQGLPCLEWGLCTYAIKYHVVIAVVAKGAATSVKKWLWPNQKDKITVIIVPKIL